MTRTYAALRLLEHGPLTFAEMREITGWTKPTVYSAVRRLLRRKTITPVHVPGSGRYVYRLA